MRYCQREVKMQGWVVYERCRERILLRLPPPKDVKGKKWRGWSRPGSPRAKGREAQSYTVMPDSPVPQHRHLGANDYDLYRQSPPYQKGGSSSLGHDPLHTDTRQNQGPACPDIHQTSLQQNLTRLDSSRPDLDSHSVYPDSLEVKDPMQCEADEDWQEFYLSHCLNAGNVWKLCWEDDQSLSPIFDEGQQSLARTQCRQRDDVDRLLFPVYEDSLQSLARRPCPQRDDMDRALFPVLDKDQPGVDRALSPIVEEGCQSLAETSTSPVPEENQEVLMNRPFFPTLEESCQTAVDRPLSPISEESDESAVDRPLSPILEEDYEAVIGELFAVALKEDHQPIANRFLSPILEEDCQSTTIASCQDEQVHIPLSSVENDPLSATAGDCLGTKADKPLSPISEESCSSTSSPECLREANEKEDARAYSCDRNSVAGTFPARHQSLLPEENRVDCGKTKKDCEDAGGGGGGGEGEGKIPVIHNWFLVDPCNKKLRLPRTMLFLGRDECDIIIQSGTVDKRHAVITFDLYLSRFKVKDLSTTNGTYVNESRIPEQEYVTLNHMDTIRLGYDSKVYHMEQGEPCTGDSPHSPSPPLSLQQSPPPPSVHLSGGDLACSTEATKASADPTGWTRGHKDSTRPMAECQGCIAEQRIEHTCTHAIPSHLHHVHHHHETCPSRDPGDHQFVEVQRKHTEKAERDEPGKEEDCESVSPEPDHSDTESPSEQKTRQARNTWPRKKVRQSRRAVAADLFAAAAAADDEDGVGEDVSGEILVENGTNYFVSVDDSAVGESGRGRMVVEYSLSRTGSVHRIPRGNSKNPLPPELETVKKGTPLYGQPSWWGEDTQTGGDKDSMDPQKPEARSPRPSSLVMHGDGSHPHHPQEQHPKGYYMEIPHHAATPERDKPQRDKTTPARSSTSSISKDSLVLSPVSARGRSVDKESDPGRSASGGFCAAEAALSFTVEFGDEKKPKLKSGASLSQFVPMKLRNSLRTHARPEKASSRGRDSDGSCKNSEERELSPTASVKQRRLEEQYAASSETSSKGKSSRRSSGQGTGVGSLKSSDFGLEITTPVSTKSRKDGDRRTREAEKEVDKKPPQPQEPRKSSSSSSRVPITKGSSKAKPQPSAAAIAASVQAAQYADSTAFLIDRMFAGDTESPRSASSDPERCESPTAPEHVMYKEAREYDRASQRGSGTYRVSGGGSGKPVQKQKSLSKSPASTSKSPAVSTSSAKSPAATASPRTSKKMAGSKTPEKQSRLVKEKSVEAERPLVSAVPAPPPAQTLPEAPSPITGGDQEDKVSEAGTYTIEVEEDGEEELMARQQIDEIFGVDDNGFNFERPVIGAEGGPLRGQGQEVEEEEGEEKTLHEDEGESMEPGCHTPCDIEGDNVFDDDEEEGVMSRSMGEEEVPSWVSQLNSLTSSIRHSPASPGEASRKDVTAKGTDEASKKPPQGLSRKRPGTGRKLPSIPLASDQSPVSSEHSSHLHHSPISPAGAPAPTRLENGHDHSTDDSPSRSVQFSPDLSSSGAKSRLEGSPCGSEDLGTSSINSGAIPKGSSVYSRGSIDTELLLRDTETVMAAMEARIGFSRDDKGEEEEGAESDTDLTSTVAMVNGDEDYVKPTKYHSPRDKMAGKVGKDKDNSNIRIASASSSRKILSRSQSEQKPPLKSSRSGAGVSVVSDVLSRSNSLDQSFQSDASDGGSSDRTETTFSRSGSRGKGTVTMSKPNRALALRQAHAHRTETTDTARSRASAASTAASSARRSSSIHGTPRTSYSDRTGTEASLGAQIVKKARDNTTASKARESSVTRQERAQRDSLRATDRRSSASSSSSSTISSAKKERDIRTLKSQLRSTPGNKDLAITGFSRCSQSQPGSRSNSPKAAERMAWKRRKDYDPRKSVADAKAKGKEPRPKPKVQSSSLYKQTMSRSASFTNTAELSGRARHDTYNVDSISSVEDLSSAATAASDPYGGTGLRRAFIPFHNPLRSNRLSHSADEDEAGTFPPSQEPSSRSKPPAHPVSLMLHKSAFTPPLSKLHTPSPDSPSPQASLLLRRRTVGADFDEAGASTAASSHRTQADSYATQSSSPQSYDSLIVSSIYQLSLKLKTTMDKALMKLREQDRASITPSPIDDFLGHPAKSDIPAWKSANQELTGVLKNLRKMEHHLHLMERALFPDEDTDTTVSGMSTSEKHKYFQEIERIRSELADFHPIDGPPSQDPGSPEMDELSKNIH